MAADVAQHDGSFLEERSQHAMGARQLTDLRGPPFGDPSSQEPGETAPPVGDPEGRVSRPHQRACRAQDPAQDEVEVGVVGERQQVENVTGKAVAAALLLHGRIVPGAGLRVDRASCRCKHGLRRHGGWTAVDRRRSASTSPAVAGGVAAPTGTLEVLGWRCVE